MFTAIGAIESVTLRDSAAPRSRDKAAQHEKNNQFGGRVRNQYSIGATLIRPNKKENITAVHACH